MATTLSYGFIKPVTGDTGAVFFPALESNIQKLNDHTHNGTNSPLLTAASSTVVTGTISSGSWSHDGGGTYSQTVTVPGSLNYDDVDLSFRNDANGNIIYPTVEKQSATTYKIYVNDNTLDLTVVVST